MAVVQIFRIRLQVDELSKGGRGIIIIHTYQTKLTKLFCPFHSEDKMSLCLPFHTSGSVSSSDDAY